MLWKTSLDLEVVNDLMKGTLGETLGIKFTEFGDDYIVATMPVDERTVQPFGSLHGGASVALAETIGSYASNLCVDVSKHKCVGLDINANHIKAVKQPSIVKGIGKPLHIGRKTHVWEIKIYNETDELVCISRLTVAII